MGLQGRGSQQPQQHQVPSCRGAEVHCWHGPASLRSAAAHHPPLLHLQQVQAQVGLHRMPPGAGMVVPSPASGTDRHLEDSAPQHLILTAPCSFTSEADLETGAMKLPTACPMQPDTGCKSKSFEEHTQEHLRSEYQEVLRLPSTRCLLKRRPDRAGGDGSGRGCTTGDGAGQGTGRGRRAPSNGSDSAGRPC